MSSVHDVAAYILEKKGSMTAMKLQKLVYYSQAWALVWDEKPIFQARIEAWANGPVCPALYSGHRGQYRVSEWPQGDSSNLPDWAKETIDVILSFYGSKSSHWLSNLTHAEDPWRNAREGLSPGERSNRVIGHAAMAEYYDSLVPAQA